MHSRQILILLLFFCWSLCSNATEPHTVRDFFTLIGGSWQSEQEVFGKPSHTSLDLKPALNGAFFHLDYAIETTDGKGVFAGAAYYKVSDSNSTTAQWFSSQGESLPIQATIVKSVQKDPSHPAMVSLWGEQGKTIGRTRYQLLADGRLEITDWLQTDNKWQQFNNNILFRAVSK